jgi:hypothetical protein
MEGPLRRRRRQAATQVQVPPSLLPVLILSHDQVKVQILDKG